MHSYIANLLICSDQVAWAPVRLPLEFSSCIHKLTSLGCECNAGQNSVFHTADNTPYDWLASAQVEDLHRFMSNLSAEQIAEPTSMLIKLSWSMQQLILSSSVSGTCNNHDFICLQCTDVMYLHASNAVPKRGFKVFRFTCKEWHPHAYNAQENGCSFFIAAMMRCSKIMSCWQAKDWLLNYTLDIDARHWRLTHQSLPSKGRASSKRQKCTICF